MQARAKWWLYIGLALAFGVVVGVWLHQSHTGAPSYQDKHVRTWVMEAYAGTNVSAAFAAMGSSAVPVLVELLQKQELPWRRQVRLLAPKLPGHLREVLFGRASETPTPVKLRCGAARCLGILGPQAESAAGQLAQAMRDPEPAVRSDAVSALARLGKVAVPHLTLALQEKDPHVRQAAAFFLGRMGPEAAPAVPGLALALQDKEAAVRVAATMALQGIGPRAGAAVPALIESLQDPDPSVRSFASSSLSAIGTPNVLALVNLINHGDLDAQRAATQALVQNYRALRLTAATFRKLAQSKEPASRELALETLGILRADDEATLNTLSAGLRDPDPKVRLAAAKALPCISWKAQAALPALTACLEDQSPAVRAAAKEALDQIQKMNR
jgi:HEAT repeat protein